MEWIQQFFHNLRNLEDLIAWGGYLVLFCIVYAETGLMVGFFLPGDSLLFVAGAFAARYSDKLDIGSLILLLCIAAIAGDNTGYWFGRKTGPRLFARPDSRIFKRKHLLHAQEFYDRHGPKTIVLARFVPIVRTFAPIVAGVAQMSYRRFLLCSVLGGIFWITSMCLLGFFLGNMPIVKQHFEKAVILIIALSVLPMIMHYFQERKRHQTEAGAIVEAIAPGLEVDEVEVESTSAQR